MIIDRALGLWIGLGLVTRDKVRVSVSIMVRVTFASVLECTGIRNLHLAIATLAISNPSYSVNGKMTPNHSTDST